MNETFRTLYALNLGYCKRLLADIADDEMLHQPSPDVNTPAWLLGHLAICTDYALELMGQAKQLPESWGEQFGPQSKPLPDGASWPGKQELWEAHAAGHARVAAATESVQAEILARPNPLPFEFLKKALPTAGDLLGHLMTTHEASHLGHLSNWRRQMGRPPLF